MYRQRMKILTYTKLQQVQKELLPILKVLKEIQLHHPKPVMAILVL